MENFQTLLNRVHLPSLTNKYALQPLDRIFSKSIIVNETLYLQLAHANWHWQFSIIFSSRMIYWKKNIRNGNIIWWSAKSTVKVNTIFYIDRLENEKHIPSSATPHWLWAYLVDRNWRKSNYGHSSVGHWQQMPATIKWTEGDERSKNIPGQNGNDIELPTNVIYGILTL